MIKLPLQRVGNPDQPVFNNSSAFYVVVIFLHYHQFREKYE
jgi:hypothetical protein